MPSETEREAGNGRRETWLTRAVCAARRIIGAPDYRAYLEHCQHAGHAPRLTEKEYVREFFESKGKGVRCC